MKHIINSDEYFDKFDNTEDGSNVECSEIEVSVYNDVIYLTQKESDSEDIIRLTKKQFAKLKEMR